MLRYFTLLVCLCWLVPVQAATGQTLRLALDADPVSLDPHEQLSEGALQYSHMVFDPLVRWNTAGQIEPRLVQSWQILDSRTWRLQLREGVKFHSGNDFTASDVAYTIARLQESTDFKALFGVIDHVTVENPYSVTIHTRHSYPLMLNILAFVFPIDSEYYQGRDEITKFGRSFASANASGTGPFMVTERLPGQKLTLTRNADYWDQYSPGNIDQLEWIPIRSDSTRLAALMTGDVDVIASLSPIDIQRLQRKPNIHLASLISSRIIMLQLNQSRRKELQDWRVRRAINLAINQELIVKKILRGYGEAAGQVSASQFLGHVDALVPEYDLAEAKRLMKEAGYEQGFSLSFMAPNNRYMSDEQIAQAVVGMLDKINIKVALKTLPKAQYFQQFDERAADIMMLGWQSDTLDSNNIFEFLFACQNPSTGRGVYNANGYCNKQVDDDIDSANREMNPERRIRILQRIERKIKQDAVIVPLHWQAIVWASDTHVDIDPVLNFQNFPYVGDLVRHSEAGTQ